MIYRLIRDEKVVGWEKHENGRIYHGTDTMLTQEVAPRGRFDYIPHDRKDRFAFVSPLPPAMKGAYYNTDKIKIFENDIVVWTNTDGILFTKTVNWNGIGGCWDLGNLSYHYLKESGYYQTQLEVIGIHGVKGETP